MPEGSQDGSSRNTIETSQKPVPQSVYSNLSLQTTSHKLNGQYYLQWLQSVKMFIRGKGKFGYISFSTKIHEEGDAISQQWKVENAMIMDAIAETFSNLGDSTQLYEIKAKIRDLK